MMSLSMVTREAIFTAEHKQFENKYLTIYFFKSLIHYAPWNLLFAPPLPWTHIEWGKMSSEGSLMPFISLKQENKSH